MLATLVLLLVSSAAAASTQKMPVRIKEGRYYIRLQEKSELYKDNYVASHLGRRVYIKQAKPEHAWEVYYPNPELNRFGLRTVAPPTSQEPGYVETFYIALDGVRRLRMTVDPQQAALFTAFFAKDGGQATGTVTLKTPLQTYLTHRIYEIRASIFSQSQWQFRQATWYQSSSQSPSMIVPTGGGPFVDRDADSPLGEEDSSSSL